MITRSSIKIAECKTLKNNKYIFVDVFLADSFELPQFEAHDKYCFFVFKVSDVQQFMTGNGSRMKFGG